MRPLSGYLLSTRASTIEPRFLGELPVLKDRRQVSSTKWIEYRYHSPVPLQGEAQFGLAGFDYRVLCRHSGPRLLLLSEGKEVVDVLVDQEIVPALGAPLRRVRIPVDDLAKSLAAEPGEFVLS